MGPDEAAEVFGVRPSTMQRWGRNGKVPTITYPNGRRMFSKEWCLQYIENRARGL